MVKGLVASLGVVAILEDGKRVDIAASIRPPHEAEGGQWIASVLIKPLQDKPMEVRGVDSFHAVWLACSLVLKLLAELKERGAKLENADGSDFPLEAYLAGLDGKR
jgi:hypothetical protein